MFCCGNLIHIVVVIVGVLCWFCLVASVAVCVVVSGVVCVVVCVVVRGLLCCLCKSLIDLRLYFNVVICRGVLT